MNAGEGLQDILADARERDGTRSARRRAPRSPYGSNLSIKLWAAVASSTYAW
jgi:hypothetical protein